MNPGHGDCRDSPRRPRRTPASQLPVWGLPACSQLDRHVPRQMGWLSGPHPLSLAPLCTQVREVWPGAGAGGRPSGAHALLRTRTRDTCSEAGGRRHHPSHLTHRLLCQSAELARAGSACCQLGRRPCPARGPLFKLSFEWLFKEAF